MKRTISIFLTLLIVASACVLSAVGASAAGASISYAFKNDSPGFAEGTITLTAPAGTYWLYWADDTKALDGYYKLAKLSVSSKGSASHKMYERSAVPVDATKLIAINSTSEPGTKTVASASAVYDIPKNKLLGYNSGDKKYRFASYSDVHIDGVKLTYKYDTVHWRKALDTAAARDTDFIVMSGDYINNNIDYSGISAQEWHTYERVLAESDYCNPVYEAIGNHELWQSKTEGTKDFIKATGLDGSTSSAPKAYFEKTLGGDHFIFMALEESFYPDRTEEFTDAQLDWLEGLLKKYSGDGKNLYIIEHSLFYKYGAGDKTDGEPYYDIPLSDNYASTRRLKSLLEKYKDAIFLSGHTHIAFEAQYNFSDNNQTSAQMIHNSSIGGVRHIVNGTLDRDYKEDDAEGYIVDVYDGAILFNGANVYYNMYDPNCCYIINPSSSFFELPTEPVTQTDTAEPSPTATETESVTASESEAETKDSEPSETTAQTETTGKPTESTEPPTETQTETETEPVTEPKLIGDVNLDGGVNVKDATLVQKSAAKLAELTEEQSFLADVNFDGNVNVKDATDIQKYVARIIDSFGSGKKSVGADIAAEVKSNLDTYYRYSSYDCYQALKKAYRAGDSSNLTTLNAALLAVVDPDNIDANDTMTVYFENTKGWSSVYAYNWGRNGVGSAKAWPGEKLTAIGKNEYGKSIYKYNVTDSKFNWVIFSGGTDATKTEDILLTVPNLAYYISGSSAPYAVTSYGFKESYLK